MLIPRLTWQEITLQLRNPFHVSYGVSDTRQAFWIRLAGDEGWGEGTIPPYYHVPTEDMIAFWQAAAHRRDPFPDDLSGVVAWIEKDGPAPARSSLDLALTDRLARRAGLPLYQFLGLPQPRALPTSFTISIDTPEEMARMSRQVANYPALKIKLGAEPTTDVDRVAAIRQARPDARLRVDANAGWTPEEAIQNIKALEPFNLELVEQPVAKEDIQGMGYVQAHTTVPVVADESVQTMENVEQLARAGVRGINIKLMKVGGLNPALRIAQRARQLGLQIMLGCMIETSLGTCAMAHLSGLADWLDLDAPLLVANDPFEGLHYDQQGRITLPDRPGIGVELLQIDE